jgi:hypothetical protein
MDGRKSRVWILRAQGEVGREKLADFNTGADDKTLKWTYGARCAFCMRAPPYGEPHDHSQCPLIGQFNKLREGAGLHPIRVNEANRLEADWVRKEDDLDKKVTKLTEQLTALAKRVSSLEKDANKEKKRKASSTSEPTDKKKAKVEVEVAVAGPSAPARGKGKKAEKGKAKAKP